MSEKPKQKLVLKHPIARGSETITELEFRRPKGKDFRRFPLEATTDDVMKMAANLSGTPDDVFDELDVDDFTAVMDLVSGFFPNAPEIGKK